MTVIESQRKIFSESPRLPWHARDLPSKSGRYVTLWRPSAVQKVQSMSTIFIEWVFSAYNVTSSQGAASLGRLELDF